MPRGPVEETRKPPKGHRALAFAVVEQGVRSVAPLLAKERVEKPHGGGRKGSGRVFSDEELARAAALHQVERNWNVVAQAMGTAQKTLVRALRDAGIEVTPRSKARFNPSVRG